MISYKLALKLAAVTFLCLTLLIVNSIATSSPNSISILSYGTIAYSNPAVLLFKSSWESPVDFTGSTKIQFKGADQGFDWSDYVHLVNYVEGELGVEVDSRISTSMAHSGSRSFYEAQLQICESGELHRTQLQFYAHDTNPLTGRFLGPNIYVSKWVYLPSNFDLPHISPYGWVCIGSYRELRSPNPDFSIPLYIYSDSTNLYWYIQGILYGPAGGSEGMTRFWVRANHVVPVPKGRWFRIETYVERHVTNGVVKVWVDGNLIFDLQGVRTKYDNGYYTLMLAKMMVGSEDIGYTFPYYQWIDDLEIWNGIPS